MENITVLNFGTYLSGPLTAKYLQQNGARIITIKPPKDSKHYKNEQNWNKNVVDELLEGQEVYYIDIKTDKNKIVELIKSADVLIENFRPFVMDRLGLSCEYCISLNKNILYVSIPGFNSSDNENNALKSWESIVLAKSGVFKDMGLNRQLMKIPASYSSLKLASTYASIFAAFSIVSKLFMYRRTGTLGDNKIEVSLASALSEALVHNSIKFEKPYSFMTERSKFLIEHPDVKLKYSELSDIMDPFFSHYMCADGIPFYLVAPSHKSHQIKTLSILGLSDLLSEIPLADPYGVSTKQKDGLGGVTTGFHSQFLRSKFKEKFLTKTSKQWEVLFGDGQVPTSAHRKFTDWLQSSHACESGLVHIDKSNKVKLGSLCWFHSCSKFTKDLKDPGIRGQFCLSGINVLDLSNVIAGPTIGMMLARMGANVTKIDNIIPSYAPDITVIYGLSANQGKRSALIDIKTKNGRRVLDSLISEADILIINTTDQNLKELQLDADSLRSINENILLVHFDAWGGPKESGFMKNYLGYDDNIQAALGIMERFGGGLHTVEEHAHIGTIDVIAGVATAFSSVCALLYAMNGNNYVSRCSLASVGQYIQYPFACGYIDELTNTALVSSDRKGTECRGEHLLNRCYEAKNGWFILVMNMTKCWEQVVELCTTIDTHIVVCTYEEAEHFLCDIFKTRSIQYWTMKLDCATLCELNCLSDIRREYTGLEMKFDGGSYQFLRTASEMGEIICIAPIAIRTSHIDNEIRFMSKYGNDTIEVLKFINLDYDESCMALKWCDTYLPYSNECPICYSSISKKYVLECEHIICKKCATVCMIERMKNCPLCRSSQETQRIHKQIQDFRKGYYDWRKGKSRGSHDNLGKLQKVQRSKSW